MLLVGGLRSVPRLRPAVATLVFLSWNNFVPCGTMMSGGGGGGNDGGAVCTKALGEAARVDLA